MTENVSLSTVLIVAIVTGGVGIGFNIIWDWLKKRRAGESSEDNGNGVTLEKIKTLILSAVESEGKIRKEQIEKIECNDMIHLEKKIDENKTEINNVWTEVNKVKGSVTEVAKNVEFIKGKMNGKE